MSNEVFEKIIYRIKREDIDVSKFILCLNGEPLTDIQLFERIRRLKSEFPNTSVEFTSNFALADENIIDNMISCGLDKIVISLNSVDASKYNEIMGLDYQNTLKNIDCLLKKINKNQINMNVCLSIVASEDNVDEVIKFKEMYSGMAEIRVIKLGQWIDKVQSENICVHSREGICTILYRTVNILANGDFALCCFDAEGIIGKNIMNCTIAEAWKSKVFDEIREWHKKYGRTNERCINCSF
jgi:MoaA/NifB/PqqE/SkfB family radical SAM enzyme